MADRPVNNLSRKVKRLEAELEDFKNSEKFVLSEDCPTDEKHCGCVPILKSEVKRVRVELDDWKMIARNRGIGWAKENEKVIELKGS